MTLTLRPYQQQAVDALFAWFEGDGHASNPLIVLPCGTGKSLMMAATCRRSIAEYGDMKIVVVTHVMELIKQNHDEMLKLWPEADVGIYSAGIGQRKFRSAITFCGIQSVHKKAHLFQKVDFLIIDECDLLGRNDTSMYQRFIKSLKVANPHMKIIGLTATPYRMDTGMLHTGDGAMFDDICYEYSVLDGIKDGYLTSLITKATKTTLDVDGVHTRGGEFIPSELQDAVDLDEINEAAADEICEWGKDRKSWLIFGSGVEHCKHLAEKLTARGIPTSTIFGDTDKTERAQTIAAFKRGEIRALSSMNVLGRGFNATAVDLVALVRPTQSPGLYVQMLGRGMRLHPGKTNALILDFARNIERHGPVDQVRTKKGPHKDKTDEETGGPLVKTCPQCKSMVHLSVMECPDCGFLFPKEIKLVKEASVLPVLSTGYSSVTHDVDAVHYSTHVKPGKPPSMRVSYECGFLKFSEYCCPEHEGYARQKFVSWWLKRAGTPAPRTVEEAIERKRELKTPDQIEVKRNGKFDEIVRYVFDMPYVPPGSAGVPFRSQST